MDRSINILKRSPGDDGFKFYVAADRTELEALVVSGAYKVVVPFPDIDASIIALVESSESGEYSFSTAEKDYYGVVFVCGTNYSSLLRHQSEALRFQRYPLTYVKTGKPTQIGEKCRTLLRKFGVSLYPPRVRE